jgi:predicted nuclease of restriction endonuclease-like (RecB) superfamily
MSSEKNTLSQTFLQEVREMLAQARQKTYATVHFIMVETYWRVGRRIVEEEQQGKGRADYGAFLMRELSRSLSSEFGKGFAVANLWNFRQFYLTFPTEEKLFALRRELTWSHYRLIMRVDQPEARDFYLREAAAQGWSTRQLERNIQTHSYERLINKPAEQLPAESERMRPSDFVKDPYVLEFLHLPENAWGTEKTLESALIENLQQFLLELGKGFSFVGRQFRISTETSHFYIDLVFYNYRSYVVKKLPELF